MSVLVDLDYTIRSEVSKNGMARITDELRDRITQNAMSASDWFYDCFAFLKFVKRWRVERIFENVIEDMLAAEAIEKAIALFQLNPTLLEKLNKSQGWAPWQKQHGLEILSKQELREIASNPRFIKDAFELNPTNRNRTFIYECLYFGSLIRDKHFLDEIKDLVQQGFSKQTIEEKFRKIAGTEYQNLPVDQIERVFCQVKNELGEMGEIVHHGRSSGKAKRFHLPDYF